MTYELVKKLYDNGFPEVNGDGFGTVMVCPHNQGEIGCPDALAVPSLSELIAACGNKFELLQRADTRTNLDWEASSFGKDMGFGSIPEVAVANLYIALNQK